METKTTLLQFELHKNTLQYTKTFRLQFSSGELGLDLFVIHKQISCSENYGGEMNSLTIDYTR